MRTLVIPLLTTVLTVAVMTYQVVGNHEPVMTEAPNRTFHDLAGYTFEEVEETEMERNVLPGDTTFAKRAYYDEEGRAFHISVVTSGRLRASIHRPELCLPAQGFQMRDPRKVTAAGVDWHVLTLARGTGGDSSFAYTAVNQVGRRTSSHFMRIFWDVWDRCIHCQIDRWTQISVFAPGADEATLRGFLEKVGEVVR